MMAHNDSKVIDITVEEKATGEAAGAGFGTDGGTLLFGIENNYLGKGLIVEAKANLSADSIKGQFGVTSQINNE